MRKSCSTCSLAVLVSLCVPALAAPRKVVLLAGAKSHGPSVHEYAKSAKLLKVLLDGQPDIAAEVHFNGWPEDPRTLETAATIVILSDGQPSDRLPPMPLMTPDRMAILERQMKRGCGLISIHYSTFITYNFAAKTLDWQGGYYEWKPPPGRLPSRIKTVETAVTLPNPRHPILQGIEPFPLKDEYYFRLRLHPGHTPILRVPELSAEPEEQTVAWSLDRPDGGRAFATSTGHFFANWRNDSYRRLILNAILWTAHAPVPPGGVASAFLEDAEVNRRLANRTWKALIVAPPAVAAQMEEALDAEIPRFQTTVVPLAGTDLSGYDLVLVHAQPLTAALEDFSRAGGGVVLTASTASGIRQIGKGRVFETILAAEPASLADPGVTQMIRAGAIWAVRRD